LSYLWITILSFVVVIPAAVGVLRYSRIPDALEPVVWLCIMWLFAEVYSYSLRVNGIMNAHVSYVLTAFEIFLFSKFYDRACTLVSKNVFSIIGWGGFVLVACDFIFINTPLNTFSLSVEYVIVTIYALLLYYEIVVHKSSRQFYGINLILLFYMLSSFPYFFAWEWLRVSDMKLLLLFGNVHAIVHTICYLLMALILWKSSSSLSRQSSYP